MKILVTGTAGFIGFHLARRLLEAGDEVVGVDSVNDYYDVRLKADRLAQTGIDLARAAYGEPVRSDRYPAYRFVRLRLEDREGMERLFAAEHFDAVCNLAAQAGVRYSIENPESYVQSNVEGFLHVLEGCRLSLIHISSGGPVPSPAPRPGPVSPSSVATATGSTKPSDCCPRFPGDPTCRSAPT